MKTEIPPSSARCGRATRWTGSPPRALRLFGLVAITVLSVSGLAGCASQQHSAQRFQAFAQAGVSYAESLPAVLDESFKSTVELDSLLLVNQGAQLNDAERLEAFAQHNDPLEKRLEIFRDIERHTRLLRSYFLSLSALASVDAEDSGLLEVTNALVGHLGEVGIDLAGEQLGGMTIGELLPGATELLLGRFKSKALRRELERNGLAIERELRLQQALLQTLAEIVESELEAKREANLTALGFEFASGDEELTVVSLSARRLAALRLAMDAHAVTEAARAADSLHRSFVALAENRFDQANLQALLNDVNSVLATIRSITKPGE